MPREPSAAQVRAARIVAISVDLVQIAILPAFFPGALSPVNDVLDAAAAVALVALVGWHWSFLPTFAAELVPFVDLVPTWTAAVFLATRGQGAAAGSSVEAVVEASPGPGEPKRLPAADQAPPRGPSGS